MLQNDVKKGYILGFVSCHQKSQFFQGDGSQLYRLMLPTGGLLSFVFFSVFCLNES